MKLKCVKFLKGQKMKYKLSKRDMNLIEEVAEKTCVDYDVDKDGFIEVDNLMALIEDLKDVYDKLEDKFIEYDEQINEDYREYFINKEIDRGLHPHEYE